MEADNISIHIERVDNGWVMRGWGLNHPRHDGYMPDGTQVASTPGQLSQIIHEWASKQADENTRTVRK